MKTFSTKPKRIYQQIYPRRMHKGGSLNRKEMMKEGTSKHQGGIKNTKGSVFIKRIKMDYHEQL